MLPCLSGNALARRQAGPLTSWLSFRRGKGLSSRSYSVETGLRRVSRISSLSVGLRSAGCVSSRDRGLVRAECRWSLGAGLFKALRLDSRDAGRWADGTTGNLSCLRELELCWLGVLVIGTTFTRVKGLMGLGLGPRSARIWAFWMAMRSQETRPGFEVPGRSF